MNSNVERPRDEVQRPHPLRVGQQPPGVAGVGQASSQEQGDSQGRTSNSGEGSGSGNMSVAAAGQLSAPRPGFSRLSLSKRFAAGASSMQEKENLPAEAIPFRPEPSVMPSSDHAFPFGQQSTLSVPCHTRLQHQQPPFQPPVQQQRRLGSAAERIEHRAASSGSTKRNDDDVVITSSFVGTSGEGKRPRQSDSFLVIIDDDDDDISGREEQKAAAAAAESTEGEEAAYIHREEGQQHQEKRHRSGRLRQAGLSYERLDRCLRDLSLGAAAWRVLAVCTIRGARFDASSCPLRGL